MIPMLDLRALHGPIQSALNDAARGVIESGQYINGPAVVEFETRLSAYLGGGEVIGVSSGTDALGVALMALGVRPGDKIITTPYTFFATVGAIVRLGAIPVFVDICPDTYNINVDQIAPLIDSDTVGILPVHLFGSMADMNAINAIAQKHGLWVVEDTAQALGALSAGSMAGTMGTVGCFSFFPSKNLGASGDAGAVVTGDLVLAEKIRQLRSHGASVRHQHVLVGGNFRMDTLQAAMLNIKLAYLDEWNRHRQAAAQIYRTVFAGCSDIICPSDAPGHTYNQFVIRLPEMLRTLAIDALDMAHIAWAIHYPMPLHLQPALKYLRYRRGDMPVAENAAGATLAIPLNPTITLSDQRTVAQTIINAITT